MSPEVTLVNGVSADGRLSLAPRANSKEFGQYINPDLAKELHKLRAQTDAILVSANTVQTDDPRLTVREIETQHAPVRVVLDRTGKLCGKESIFSGKAPTVLLTANETILPEAVRESSNTAVIRINADGEKLDVREALAELASQGIERLLVEGGSRLNASFLNQGIATRLIVFTFPFIVGNPDAPSLVEGVLEENEVVRLRMQESKPVLGAVKTVWEVL